MAAREVGRLVGLWRYPVKSMAAEALERADVGWHGLAGDRRWAFVRDGMAQSDFPWLTIRQNAGMWRYRPRFAEPDRPDASRTLVQTPAGDELDVADPALAEELGHGARVIRQNRGVFDTAPLSLVSVQTVRALGAMVGADLHPLRFRPNLLVDSASGEPFDEEAWLGAVLTVGRMRFRVDRRDERCVITNLDPATLAKNPAVLRTIARERQACLGVYGTTVQPGPVAVGDPVLIDGDST